MRQIRFCAWLLVMATVACGGEKFTPNESGAGNPTPEGSTHSGDDDDRSQAGSTSTSGGSTQLTTGGKSTTAGTYGAGGSMASGGTATSAGGSSAGGSSAGNPTDEACPSGSLTFRMLPGPDLPHDYLCDAGCGTGWLTITDAEGAMAFSIFSACGTASCESCEMLPCAAAACLPTALTAEGSELIWTGTYLAKDTCGANLACQRQACVKPGKYKAKGCAALNGGNSGNSGACTPKNEQLCAETEFEFPATASVKLVLGQP
jgi:hypothetical protein